MARASISPTVLKWARERSLFDLERLAKKIPVKSQKITLWEEGDEKPTFKQAQKLAQILHIPFGYLFLPHPPKEKLPIPDLRTIYDEYHEDYSLNLKETILDVLRKQDWYIDYLMEEERESLPFIGRFDISQDTDIIAKDIISTLELSIEDRLTAPNWEEFLRLLMDRAEKNGIWIMRNGKVGNNTHRILDVEEFRGFVICDPIAPVIFLNGADAKAAQIFTLAHELTHLWLGESGVSNVGVRFRPSDIQNVIERKCNEVAAEVLVPQTLLAKYWQESRVNMENIESLCSTFRVSSIVIARRAFDLGLLSRAEFFDYYKHQQERWRSQKEAQKSGGSFYRALPIVNGRRFTEAVLQSVYSQKTLIRDGARLLGIKPSKMDRIAEEVNLL
jgi:Zn-dependent peptidase ImmA (M78 family)/DNA-binding XRE family transcriptional regulator